MMTMTTDGEGETQLQATDNSSSQLASLSIFEKLQLFSSAPNIAVYIDDEVLKKIGAEVVRGYTVDKQSREKWETANKDAIDLAMQVSSKKNFPFDGASNIKYPLLTVAAVQFSARAYPAIIRDKNVVKIDIVGEDNDGEKQKIAERISDHMSYQFTNEMVGWEEDTDMLLLQIAIIGCAFRKSYYDPILGHNCSEFVPAIDLVYDHAITYRKLRRKTQELGQIFRNDLIERVKAGIYLDVKPTSVNLENDEDEPIGFLEQHCWYDLDGDGYKEPYIVTVCKENSNVARIASRYDLDGIVLNSNDEIVKIIPTEYYTKYSFMPNPDGGSYDVGLGILLSSINKAVDSLTNQMIDAGTLANSGGGFIGAGLKLSAGAQRFKLGEFKPVDNFGGSIRDNIYHMQFPGASPVLFQLLGMLINAGKDISSTKDILLGESQGANASPTTVLALIEQGQKLFSAIYKRVYRSLTEEFKKIYALNATYLQQEKQFNFNKKRNVVFLDDYKNNDSNVVPTADPNVGSDAQELIRAEALLKFIGDPMFNQYEIRKKYVEAIKINNIDALLNKTPPPTPQDPKMLESIARLEIEKEESQEVIKKMAAETSKIIMDSANVQANTILTLAKAEAEEFGNQMQQYIVTMQALMANSALRTQDSEESNSNEEVGSDEGDERRIPGLEEQPDDGINPQDIAQEPGEDHGVMGAGGVPLEQGGGDDGYLPPAGV